MRNFECIRLAEKLAEDEAKQIKEEEATNPMKLLENRTRDSRREMAILESLEDLKELNSKNATYDPLTLVKVNEEYEKQLLKLQEEEDEAEIKRLFNKKQVEEVVSEEEVEEEVFLPKKMKIECKESAKKEETTNKNQLKTKLSNIIRKKPKQEVGLTNLCAYEDSDESN